MIQTQLEEACMNKDLSKVAESIKKGADPNGRGILSHLCSDFDQDDQHHLDILYLLLKNGGRISPSASINHYITLLSMISDIGKVRELLEEEVDSKYLTEALDWSIRHHNLDIARLLCENGGEIGEDVLGYVCFMGYMEGVEFVLSTGKKFTGKIQGVANEEIVRLLEKNGLEGELTDYVDLNDEKEEWDVVC